MHRQIIVQAGRQAFSSATSRSNHRSESPIPSWLALASTQFIFLESISPVNHKYDNRDLSSTSWQQLNEMIELMEESKWLKQLND